jgi:hypothetical protein
VEAEFDVQAPTGLAPQWRPTSARWQATTGSAAVPVLHLGYVTPADEYAQVSQSTAATPRYLDEQTDGGEPVGEQVVDGVSWERLESEDRRSLVLDSDGTMTIVSGSADWDELTTLATALRPIATPG